MTDYKEKIDECARILFSLDKEKDATAYRRESLNMTKHLYEFLMMSTKGKPKDKDGYKEYGYEWFGLEIVETVDWCIKNYKPEKGDFLAYFCKAWKINYKHLNSREVIKDGYRGGHISESTIRNLQNYKRWSQEKGKELNTEELAEALGISEEKAQELLTLEVEKPISGTVVDKDGEEIDSMDSQESNEYADQAIIDLETVKEDLERFETVYNHLQERQKAKISMVLTTKLAIIAAESDEVKTALKEKAYYNEDTFNETLKRGEPIQHKEIAKRLGIKEQSLSRSWSDFLDACREVLKD